MVFYVDDNQEVSALMNCKPCQQWNKDYNTVKVDPAALKTGATFSLNDKGKENESHSTEHVLNGKTDAKSKEELEHERRHALEEVAKRGEEQRQEMARKVKEAQERQQVEQRQLEAERRQLQAEQNEKERQEQLASQQSLQAEQQRQEKELQAERDRAEQETRQKEDQAWSQKKKVQAWLQTNGFKDVNDLVRKRLTKFTPLHFAVQQNNPEMVKLLLDAGADPLGINGKKETPMNLAEKLDKNSSHESVVEVFTTHNKPKSSHKKSKSNMNVGQYDAWGN